MNKDYAVDYEVEEVQENSTMNSLAYQKFAGLVAIGMGIFSTWFLKDGTAALLFIPMGLHMVLTRKNYMN